ncbi:MAG: hypothetical protein NC311_14445 [Muribaculaceae bacterium]|nr:hypothetical protein [Muribaculaceae bacterium]
MQKDKARKPSKPVHDTTWFAKQEARLEEPLKNTIRYKGKNAYLMIFLGLPTLILPILGAVQLFKIKKYVYGIENLTTDYMNNGRAITNDGAPGSGKTFTGGNVAYFLAQEAYQKLKSDYHTQKTMVEQWAMDGEVDKLEAFRSLEESYLFYKKHEAEYIPCLISSIPLREYGTGRMSYQLTPEMFLQQDRIPEYSIFFNDEIGEDQGVDKSATTNPAYLAFWRYPRHFFDGMFVNTNQDGNQAAIAVRRSTDYVNHLYGQEWIEQPTMLRKRYERKEKRYFKLIESGKIDSARAEYLGQELYYLKKYLQTIGFRKITCRLTTTKGVAVGDTEEIILPAIGGVQYDARAYKKQYKCKDNKIALRGWEKLAVEEYDHSDFNTKVKGEPEPKRRGS